MPQKRVLKAQGLSTFKNELTLSEGSLLQADNVVIDRDDIIESRRGFKIYGDTLSEFCKQILTYKDVLLAHYGDKLAYDSGDGNFVEFNGTYKELEDGLRIKAVESNGNMYFTTLNGIKKISALNASQFTNATDFITDAGGLKGLSLTALPNYSQTGFLEANSVVGYRVVWGYKDNNGNLILGSPSEYAIARNSSSVSCITQLNFTIPNNITDDYFYQIYRSPIKAGSGNTPEDELNLVFEDFPSETELANGAVGSDPLNPLYDITLEDFRREGALLYTNPISGEGILQANEPPPIAKDIALFKNSLFFANTVTRHRMNLNLLSVDNFVSGSSKLVISNKTKSNEYTFVGDAAEGYIDFGTYTDTVASLGGKYILLSNASNSLNFYVWFNTGASTDPEVVNFLSLEIDISAATTLAEVATAFADEVDTYVDFDAEVDTITNTKVNIINTSNGNSDFIRDGNVANSIDIQITQAGDGENYANQEVLLSSQISIGQRIDETARSLIRAINTNSDSIVNAFYLSGTEDVPGQILLENKDLEDIEFFAAVNQSNISSKFNPTLPAIKNGTVTAGDPTVITATAHGLTNTTKIVVNKSTGNNPLLVGVYNITYINPNSFSIDIATSSGGTIEFYKAEEVSDNERKPNRIYYSKTSQPEAVPIANYIDVGAQDEPILRIVALRDSLFILKTDSIHRLSGENSSSFVVSLFDSSSPIIAADSAAVLNNQIFFLSTQGVIGLSESGPSIVSRNIENLILKPTSNRYTNFSKVTFGIAYESDRCYLLFLPTETNDEVATQAYRYNVFTKTWVRWPISKICGAVNTKDDKLYFGAADVKNVEIERKDFNRTDFADREYDTEFITNSIDGTSIQLPTLANVSAFDVIYQLQYITVSRFNRFLTKLNKDPYLTKDYSIFEASNGSNLGNLIQSVYNLLITDDLIGSYTSPSGLNTPEALMADFNLLMDEVNLSNGTFYNNYRKYEDPIEYESIVTKLVNADNIVILRDFLPFIEGPAKIYNHIDSFVEWCPDHIGDPSLMKQFREATLMFDQFNFTYGKIGFRTDLSDHLENTDFFGEGNGAYGTQLYGKFVYGGNGNQRPFRTLIPRNKQRCRFIMLSFEHQSARENFGLNGYSLTYNGGATERAYRS